MDHSIKWAILKFIQIKISEKYGTRKQKKTRRVSK
jgi:hypothetical protein